VNAAALKPRREVHRAIAVLEPWQAKALVAVEVIRRSTGIRPTWHELGRTCGWPPDEVADRVRSLYPVGLRWRCGQARSLAVTPEGLRAAIRVAREGS
jgi:hypothetical protein